jgi:hypothetical protein
MHRWPLDGVVASGAISLPPFPQDQRNNHSQKFLKIVRATALGTIRKKPTTMKIGMKKDLPMKSSLSFAGGYQPARQRT